jgi:hypothetical protein
MVFDKDTDMDFRKFEVNAIIRNIYKKLPENLTYPIVQQSGGEQNDDEQISAYFNVFH